MNQGSFASLCAIIDINGVLILYDLQGLGRERPIDSCNFFPVNTINTINSIITINRSGDPGGFHDDLRGFGALEG